MNAKAQAIVDAHECTAHERRHRAEMKRIASAPGATVADMIRAGYTTLWFRGSNENPSSVLCSCGEVLDITGEDEATVQRLIREHREGK